MIRNLLYSLFLHFLIVAFFYFGDLSLVKTTFRNTPPVTISFIDTETLQEIEDKKSKSNKEDKYKDLTTDEKLELYSLAKNAKKSEKYKDKNKIYSSDGKKNTLNRALRGDESLENENTFTYYSYLVYVNEKNVTEEQRKRIEQNQEKKKKLRENIANNPNVDKASPKEMRNMDSNKTIQDIVKVSLKPVIIDNRARKESFVKSDENKIADTKSSETQNHNVNEELGEEVYDSEMEDLNDMIFASERKTFKDIELNKVNLDDIFTKDDYKNIKGAGNIDRKYDLTIREKINIQRDIKSCYKRAILKSGMDSKSIVSITVKIDRDGTIDLNKIKVENAEHYNGKNEKDFKIALENAKVALVFCSPLRNLPATKYRVWKEMNFVFDSSNLE